MEPTEIEDVYHLGTIHMDQDYLQASECCGMGGMHSFVRFVITQRDGIEQKHFFVPTNLHCKRDVVLHAVHQTYIHSGRRH